jgi:16S rRNA processing protein RimM
MIRIGKIVATHGLQGEVVLTHILDKTGWLKKTDVLFLELNKESFIPFFVTNVRADRSDECVISLEDISKVEEAKKFIGKQVYVEEVILEKQKVDSPLLWIGFDIVDREKGSLGKIEDVIQTAHQWLASITYQDKEVLIPLVKEMILDVNVRNKFIRMDLPEGLLDL